MRIIRPTVILCAALAAAMPAMPTALAEANGNTNRMHLVQRDGMTLSEAVAQVRRQYNGRIVSAETHVRGNREVHHIKVLTDDGKVKTVRIQGRTRGNRG